MHRTRYASIGIRLENIGKSAFGNGSQRDCHQHNGRPVRGDSENQTTLQERLLTETHVDGTPVFHPL